MMRRVVKFRFRSVVYAAGIRGNKLIYNPLNAIKKNRGMLKKNII